MNATVFLIEALAMTIVFTALIMIPLIKNPVWWIHDYPADIQEEYFRTHERIPSAFFSKTVLLKKGFAILLVVAFFLLLIWLAEAQGFWMAIVVSYGLWTFINWYDCFFLDWVLFANVKAIRLPGTEHMDKAYHQKTYHVVRSLYGMLIGVIPSLASSGIYVWLG